MTFALYVHRHKGVTAFTEYANRRAAMLARAEYVAAARVQGFEAERREHTIRLNAPGVQLTVWVAPIQEG